MTTPTVIHIGPKKVLDTPLARAARELVRELDIVRTLDLAHERLARAGRPGFPVTETDSASLIEATNAFLSEKQNLGGVHDGPDSE
jgi:hypothetical protein